MPTDPDAPGNEPNLELPSFGFGRKKKRGRKSGESSGPSESAESSESFAEAAETEAPQPDAGEGAGMTTEQAAVPPSPSPARPSAPRAPAAPPAPARAPAAGAPPARPPARPAARPPARPATTATPPASPAEPSPAEPAAPVIPVVDDSDSTLVDPLGQAAAALDAAEETRTRRRAERTESRARRRAVKAQRKRSAPTDSLAPRLPRINPVVAAVITGALSGLATVLLAFGAARGCDALRGTESCGGGVGLLAVIGILAIEILIGANLLKAWRIADPYSTSFLGVGVVATIAMLAFLDHINSPWMLLVIPLMTAAAFALSWWVTVRVIEEHPMSSESESERGEPAFRTKAGAQEDARGQDAPA